MNFNPIENSVSPAIAQNNAPNQDALRRTATQFEAVLLMQLTSVLNGEDNENDEDSLFGNDGGSGLAKKMFSEQLATTMSEAGGTGLSGIIMQQLGANKTKTFPENSSLANVISAVRDIKETKTFNISRENKALPLVNTKVKIKPLTINSSDNSKAVEVVSRFEDKYKPAESLPVLPNNEIIFRRSISPFMPDLDAPEEISSPAAIDSANNSENENPQMPRTEKAEKPHKFLSKVLLK